MKLELSFKVLVFSFFILNISGCRETLIKKSGLEIIDIESNIKNFSEIPLSKFNAEIRYIPLKMYNDLEISWIGHIDATADFVLISNPDLCLLYDYNGNIVKNIGAKGRGPNEYVAICNSAFGFNKNIYIQSAGLKYSSFLEYKTDGTFVRGFNVTQRENRFFYMLSWTVINDSLFLGQVPVPNIGNGKIKAMVFNKDGESRFEFKNYVFLDRPSSGYSSSEDSYASFYRYKSKLYFKEEMNDTLFVLTDKYELNPVVTFNIGKYRMPDKFRKSTLQRGGRSSDESNPANFIYMKDVFELSNYLLLNCDFGFHTPAKRITPIEERGLQQWYNTQNVLGLYNKKRKSLVFCKPTSTDNHLFTTGFYNDVDAGPRFYPRKQINDSTMVMWIEAKQLKDHIESDDFKKNVPKYPEKKKELEELANKINVLDNPILMFVTFKYE